MTEQRSHTIASVDSQPTSPLKRYKVTAIIKYDRDIGVIEAATKEEALDKAMDTPEWYRASKAPGGVWDTEIELLTDNSVSECLTESPKRACAEDVGFGFRCLREQGHAGFHTWDPKRLLGEDPIPLTDNSVSENTGKQA